MAYNGDLVREKYEDRLRTCDQLASMYSRHVREFNPGEILSLLDKSRYFTSDIINRSSHEAGVDDVMLARYRSEGGHQTQEIYKQIDVLQDMHDLTMLMAMFGCLR